MSRERLVLASFDRVPAPKGASQHILKNADALSARFEVSLVTLGDHPAPGYRHRPLPIDEPNWLRRALRFREEVGRVFELNPFDRYHVRSPWEGLAVPVGRPLVYEVNGLYSIEMGYHYPGVHRLPSLRTKLRNLELLLLERAALAITPSPVTRQYLIDLGVPPERVAVVPNGPGIPVVPRAPGSHEPLRLCYLGTLSSWQGLPELIVVLSRLELAWELTLLTGASKPQWKPLVKLAHKRGVADRVRVRPPLRGAELAAFLTGQDIAVAPLAPCERNLIQGCMPIKLLDYLAAGLPVLAPDMPVVRAVVGEDYPLYRRYGRTGLLEQLKTLCGSEALRHELGQRGQERMRGELSAARSAERLLEAYERLG